MKIVDIIKSVGHGIAAVASWPFKHAAQLAHILHVTTAEVQTVEQRAPATKEALVELVARIEAMGPEVLAAIAARGFDIADDLKTLADLKGIFGFVQSVIFPTIRADYDALKDAATGDTSAAVEDPAPAEQPSLAQTEAPATELPSPGLHNTVPA